MSLWFSKSLQCEARRVQACADAVPCAEAPVSGTSRAEGTPRAQGATSGCHNAIGGTGEGVLL